MAWYSFVEMGSLVFSPKVTPDPADAKRLAEKFQLALQKTQNEKPQNRLRIVAPPPSLPENRTPEF